MQTMMTYSESLEALIRSYNDIYLLEQHSDLAHVMHPNAPEATACDSTFYGLSLYLCFTGTNSADAWLAVGPSMGSIRSSLSVKGDLQRKRKW